MITRSYYSVDAHHTCSYRSVYTYARTTYTRLVIVARSRACLDSSDNCCHWNVSDRFALHDIYYARVTKHDILQLCLFLHINLLSSSLDSSDDVFGLHEIWDAGYALQLVHGVRIH